MAYLTFNGWNIIPMPATPAPRQIDFTANDTVGEVRSIFTGRSQFMQWPGADWWELNVSLPAMKLQAANAWIAWLLALRGKANVFQIGDPLGAMPQGNPQGAAPLCRVAQPAMATALNTSGWPANAQNLLLPGDYLQVGYRLHRVAGASAVSSDASGFATVEIWPSLREATSVNQPIQLYNTTGLFRLSDNKREWTARETRLFGLSFKATEAR